MTSGQDTLSVGMVGYAFMGAAHSQAWRQAPRFFDLPRQIRMSAVAGRDQPAVARAAERLGWESTESSWQALVDRDDIDLVDICTPGDTHAEIAIAALQAGKHVLCEKPLANSVEEAEAMTRAADRARASGVRSMVGFTYRRVPAIALARQLVTEGRLGTVHHGAPSISRTGSSTRRRRCPGDSTRPRPAPEPWGTSVRTSSTSPS